MDCAWRNSIWVLAGVGSVSDAGARIQLCLGRRAGRLAGADLYGLCGALEQECKSWQCVRCLVFESVSTDEPLCIQWRRVSDAQLYSDAGNDAAGNHRSAVVYRIGPEDSGA